MLRKYMVFFSREVKLFGSDYPVSNTTLGCAILLAGSWWFLTLEAWVQFQIFHME
jgi:hypothetical protein